ncbi:hypothetical protein PshuTeo2_26800 [Pseudomonas hunanensis]|nr:hypothetical protein [Pseudomonas hunanensis]PNG87713.1 Cytochrome bo(3) ubiquinol oxidase subunit 2 precursor [Pseudomonas putida]
MATRFTYGARLLGLMLLSIGALQLSGCDMVLFNPKGQVGLEQRNLIILATLLMLIVVVPVMIMALVFSVHYRASNEKARYTPEWNHSRAIEAVVWGVPLIIIIVLGVVTWRSTHALDPYRPLVADRPAPRRCSPSRPLRPSTLTWMAFTSTTGIRTCRWKRTTTAPSSTRMSFNV